MPVNGRPTVGVIPDGGIIQNIAKSGSVLSTDELLDDFEAAALEVPEPAPLALPGFGTAAMAAGRRRRAG